MSVKTEKKLRKQMRVASLGAFGVEARKQFRKKQLIRNILVIMIGFNALLVAFNAIFVVLLLIK